MSLKYVKNLIYAIPVGLLIILAVLAVFMARNQGKLNASQQVRYQSYQAADELRQISSDLTRLGRTYVSTGAKKYEDMYWEVLDIQHGKKPRPDGRTIPLEKIMENLGFTEAEFGKLKKAAQNSDDLVWTETIAMNAVKGLFHDNNKKFTITKEPDFKFARDLMFNEQYHKYVQDIMAPINEFFVMLDKRSKGQVDELVSKGDLYLKGILGTLVLLAISGILAMVIARRSLANAINNVVVNLTRVSQQVSEGSNQISASSQLLAEGSSEQAASIEETSSSLEEMSSMTKQNADNANQADTLMKEANLVVGQANDSMGELTSSMEEISKASEETSKIIKTIDEIAFQTNLLALNAAVEAARAGEAGAGFAVVADEVRNLAMRAADAAKNTAQMIESTVKKVTDGSELVSSTNAAFSEVASSAGKVGRLVGEIAAASNEQAQGIEQVNTAVAEMDKVVQQNAANAEESASASAQMSGQAEQIKGMVGKLSALVGGSSNRSGRGLVSAIKTLHTGSHKPVRAKTAKGKDLIVHKPVKVHPEQVIPMDDDFKDF